MQEYSVEVGARGWGRVGKDIFWRKKCAQLNTLMESFGGKKVVRINSVRKKRQLETQA